MRTGNSPLADRDGGMAGANIRVGLLFDPARVRFSDRGNAGPEASNGIRFSSDGPSLTLNPGRIAPAHPAFAGDSRCHWAPSRKALAAEFEIAGRRLFVIACHFKSMRALNRREEDYAKSSVTSKPRSSSSSPPIYWLATLKPLSSSWAISTTYRAPRRSSCSRANGFTICWTTGRAGSVTPAVTAANRRRWTIF